MYNKKKKHGREKMISIEVRKLIVAARKNGMKIQEILRTFQVKKTAVYNLFQLVRETGSVEPRPHAYGRKPTLNSDGLKRMEDLIDAQPDITFQEIKDKMDLQISIPAISKIISGKLHYRYKKRRYMPASVTVRMYR
ncbi:MAG: hypothetical protein GX424_03355 [Clostridiales bacterium]|nr:hypothetical protein [Clostridiales bacterium]